MTTTDTEPTRLLVDTRTAARMLSISPRTLWALTASGTLPVVRLGRRLVRFDPMDLRAWLDSRKRENR